MNFSVDSQILTNIDPDLSKIENEIKHSANAAYDVGKRMRMKSLASEILSLKLRSNARTIMSLADNVKSYRTALKSITQEYVTYETAIREEFQPGGARRIENLTQKSGIFDDQGSYGGDQGDMIDNQAKTQILWWTIGGNQALYDAVRTYPKYADYTDDQIKDLFSKISGEGCGYVAMANAILHLKEISDSRCTTKTESTILTGFFWIFTLKLMIIIILMRNMVCLHMSKMSLVRIKTTKMSL